MGKKITIRFATALLISALILIVCDGKNVCADVISTAEKAIESGQLFYARDILKNFIEDNRNSSDQKENVLKARLMLGRVYMKLGNYKEAENQFQALSNSASDKEAAILLAESLYLQAQAPDIKPKQKPKLLQKCVEILEHHIEKFKTIEPSLIIDAQRLLGFAYKALDSHQKAVEAFSQALKKIEEEAKDYPRKSDILFGIGTSHYQLGNYFEASRELENLVDKYPAFLRINEARYYLGENYFYLEDFESAAKQYQEIIKALKDDKNPIVFEARFSLGWTYSKMNDYKKALDEFIKLENSNPEDEKYPIIIFKIGELYYRTAVQYQEDSVYNSQFDKTVSDKIRDNYTTAIKYLQLDAVKSNKTLWQYAMVYIADCYYKQSIAINAHAPSLSAKTKLEIFEQQKKEINAAEEWLKKFEGTIPDGVDSKLNLLYKFCKAQIHYQFGMLYPKALNTEGKNIHLLASSALFKELKEQNIDKSFKAKAMIRLAEIDESNNALSAAIDMTKDLIEDTSLLPYINLPELMLKKAKLNFLFSKIIVSEKDKLSKKNEALNIITKIFDSYEKSKSPGHLYIVLEAHFLKGQIHIADNESLLAIEEFRFIFDFKNLPDTPQFTQLYIQALRNAGDTYHDTKQYPEAIDLFEKILSLKGLDQETLIHGYTTLITDYENNEEYEKACKLGMKMLENLNLPESAVGAINAGRIYAEKIGDSTKAIDSLNAILKKMNLLVKEDRDSILSTEMQVLYKIMAIYLSDLEKALANNDNSTAKAYLEAMNVKWTHIEKIDTGSQDYYKAGNILGQAYLISNKLDLAEQHYTKMLNNMNPEIIKTPLKHRLELNIGATLLRRAETEKFNNDKDKAAVVEQAIKFLTAAVKSDNNENANIIMGTYLLGHAYFIHPTMPAEEKYKNAIYEGYWKLAYVIKDEERLEECIERAVYIYELWITYEIEKIKRQNKDIIPDESKKQLLFMIQFAKKMLKDSKNKETIQKHGKVLDDLKETINQ